MIATAPQSVYEFDLHSLEITNALAQAVAATLKPGDCLLLEGPVGAGKTAFARALIQHLLPLPEDVPSPTFTLVQTYETPDFTIWHCDLYRLTGVDELVELGLDDAFAQDVTLVEWPDRLGDLAPAGAQRLAFSYGKTADARHLSVSGDGRWAQMTELAA